MQLLLHITCVLSTHITYTTLSPAFTYKYHTALHTYIGSNPRHGTPFLPELKTGRQYYQSISNFTQFSMFENIKGFCCHYGGFCEKENFIKTTYIYNKISKQICIAIQVILFQLMLLPPYVVVLQRKIKEIETGLMRINLIVVCNVCSKCFQQGQISIAHFTQQNIFSALIVSLGS